MKVDSISNLGYSPISQREPAKTSKISAPEQKLHASAGTTSTQNGLTSAERAFFAKLFPDSSSQINSHTTYSPNGIHSSVELGQIVNRKA